MDKAKFDRCAAFLEEMLILYYPPFRADTDEEMESQCLIALQRYVSILGCHDHDILQVGWSRAVEQHKTERWPTIADIDRQCADTGAIVSRRDTNINDIAGKARPNMNYQVEMGIISRERANLMTEYADANGKVGPGFYTRMADAIRRDGEDRETPPEAEL